MEQTVLVRCPDCFAVNRVTKLWLKANRNLVTCKNCDATFEFASKLVVIEQKVVPPSVSSKNTPNRLFEDLSPVIAPSYIEHQSYAGLIGWMFGCWLAIAGLVLQYFHYHRVDFAQDDEIRPALESWCKLARCTLPARQDLSLIKTDYVGVRTNPNFNDVLRLSIVLDNQAPFAQPFPLLDFKFVDADEYPVAARLFSADEYLAGELAGQDLIPAHTQVKIVLDVLDPGIKAVNYQLSLSAN